MKPLTGLTVRIAVVLMATSFFWLSGGPAFGTHVNCGDTIIVDTELDSNLMECSGDGIIIGADDIELDLNGFIIDGDVSGTGRAGIVLEDRVGVKIEGPGVVREFTAVGGGRGIFIQGGGDHRIKGVVVADNLLGIGVLNSDNNKIEYNTVYNNDGQGIVLSGPLSTGNRVKRNEVYGHTSIGIRIVSSASDNKISENNVHNNTDGVRVAIDAHDNRIKRNQISQNNIGIRLNSNADENSFEGNDISNNVAGIQVGIGPPIDSNDNNEIEENIFANNLVGITIFAGNNNNEIEENTFSANGTQIVDNGTGTELEDNICVPACL